jgi:hypothetical protein
MLDDDTIRSWRKLFRRVWDRRPDQLRHGGWNAGFWAPRKNVIWSLVQSKLAAYTERITATLEGVLAGLRGEVGQPIKYHELAEGSEFRG